MAVTTLIALVGAPVAEPSTPPSDQLEDGLAAHAYAEWSFDHRKEPAVYFVEGLKVTGAEGDEHNYGFIGTTTCVDRKHCIGTSSLKATLGSRAFEVAPDMDAAHLSFLWGRRRQVISWDGEGLPTISVDDPSNGEAHTSRPADAYGRLLRKDVRSAVAERYGYILRGSSEGDEPRGEEPGALPIPAIPTHGPGGGAATDRLNSDVAPSNTDPCIRNKRPERRFRRLINAARVDVDENRLRLDAELSRVARKHTKEMIKRGNIYHSTAEQIRRRVTEWRVVGENVGVGATVSSLHEAFMDSRPHRENIQYPTYRFVGVGVKRADGRMWVTVLFERSRNAGTTLRCPNA